MQVISFSHKFPPFSRIGISGASNTGKSILLYKIIRHAKYVFERNVEHVIVFYLIKNEEEFSKLSEHISVEFHEGLGDLKEVLSRPKAFWQDRKIGMIFEDLQNEVYNSELASKVFTCFAHHLPLEFVIFVTQNLYQKTAKFQSMINRNLNYLVFTRSMRLKSVLPFLGRELMPHTPMQLVKVFDVAMKTEEPFPYLVINLDQEDSRKMYYSGIFPNEPLKLFRQEDES